MNKYIIVLTLLFSGIPAVAERYDTMDHGQLNAALKKAKHKIKTGTTLTISGGLTAVLGIILIENSSKHNQVETYEGTLIDRKSVAGTFLVLGGAGLTGAGIPTWIAGGVRKRKIELQLVKFNSPGAASIPGINLKIRF